jgi:chromosome segregation ATPase
MAIAIVVIIALLGINGFLWYNKVTQDRIIESHNTDMIEAERLHAGLEKDFYESLSELTEMRSANDELNAIIDGQTAELKIQKARISQLIEVEKNYDAARAELDKLRQMRVQFVAQIKKLEEENSALSASNEQLRVEKASLTDEVQSKTLENEELKSETEVLAFRNEALLKERENLSDKVTMASVVQVDDIIVNGYRVKNNGKEALTKRADKAEGLKICFEAQENTITESGEERFYVRIVDPLGETMALDEMGSGVIQDSDERQVRFTQYRDVPYENEITDACMSWQPGMSFKEGLYLVEVYNKGFLAGSTTFTLK